MMTGFEGALTKLELEKVLHRISRYAVSDPGRELLSAPRILTSAAEISRTLARTTECKALIEQEGDLPLQGIHPVRTAVQKAAVEGTTLLPRELHQIAETVRAARILRSFIAKRKETCPLLWEAAEPLFADKVLEYNIDQAVDESGAVRASASRELQAIRRSISDHYEQLRKRLEAVLRQVTDLGFSQEEIITTREGRMVIPVKTEHKNRVPGFIHSASASGATVFIEPTETLELNNEIRSLQFEEQREIERILRALTVQVGELREKILLDLGILADLDALSAKAKYSIEILGVAPAVADRGTVRLIQARHPLLLLAHGRGGTVPLDIELGDAFRTLIISGPNAGGKSVAMKCVGMLALMAQAGLHIPAGEGSTLRVFHSIFVEIGDEQSIENDLSTFSSHLSHLKQIAEQAEEQSLVLVDEIGSGTDPAEGGAIATSILESLTASGAFTIATTHQGSLKVFAHATDRVENAAMEFDQATLKPTYRLRIGVPGSSYALEMAKRLGFAEHLLEQARKALGQQQTKLDRLIADLESDAQQYRNDLNAVLRDKAHLSELVQEYETRVARLSAELREMKLKAIEEAERIVARANALIEHSIQQIRESGGERKAVKIVREQVAHLKQDITSARDEITPAESTDEIPALEAGAPVSLAGRSDVGEIVDVAPDGKSAVVLFGSVKMRVAVTDLRKAARRSAAAGGTPMQQPLKQGPIPTDLDLRGLTGEEAIPLVDKFLDDAYLGGFTRVDIIHGKGTGALRKKISEYLSTHPKVKAFRLGQWNEGGDGATIVELTDQ
jgi:DNA mismatch repair protein MutS2